MVSLSISLGKTITWAVSTNTGGLRYGFCHICFYTQMIPCKWWESSPVQSSKYQPVRLVASWISHGVMEPWSWDGESVRLQLRKHYSVEPHINRKEKRALRLKRKSWPLNCDCISAKIYRIASKLKVWHHWNLKWKKYAELNCKKICI